MRRFDSDPRLQIFLQLLDFTGLRSLPSIGLDRGRWGKKGLIRGGGYVKKYVKIFPVHSSVSPRPA
jgi:hypothetical protein